MTDDADLGFAVETCRAAFEPRHGDVRTRARRALQHADPATRRALSHLLAEHRHRRLDGDKGPTAETLVHRRRGNHTDTIEALVCSRKLGWSEQAAALQIAAVYEALTAALWTRGCPWEQGRVDGGGTNGIPMRLADLYQRCFCPWARWMTAPGSLFHACERCGCSNWCRTGSTSAIAARVTCGGHNRTCRWCCHGAGIEDCARQYRMRRQRALRLLRLGLERYHDFS